MFESAGTFYGGLFGAILTIILYSRMQRLPLLPVLDISAAALPLSHAIGRLGCFAAGCCFGKPTTMSWGVTFKDSTAAILSGTPLDTQLHPTQLYEAAAEFLNFLLLLWLVSGKQRRIPGEILGAYFMLYGVERGIIEFFRGDPGRTMMFHGSASLMQLVSGALVVCGALLYFRPTRTLQRLPTSTPPQSLLSRGEHHRNGG